MHLLNAMTWRHPERSRISGEAKDLGCNRRHLRVPSWLKPAAGCPRTSIASLAMLITLTSACRLDMHVQPRQNPLSRSDFYSDHRSARQPVEGTVARGELHEDSYFY